MNNPMAQMYQNVILRNNIGISTISDKRALVFRKHFSGNVLLYRRTRHGW